MRRIRISVYVLEIVQYLVVTYRYGTTRKTKVGKFLQAEIILFNDQNMTGNSLIHNNISNAFINQHHHVLY